MRAVAYRDSKIAETLTGIEIETVLAPQTDRPHSKIAETLTGIEMPALAVKVLSKTDSKIAETLTGIEILSGSMVRDYIRIPK